jgi:hypothetical protein
MYCVHSRVCFSIESLIMIRFCCGIMMTLCSFSCVFLNRKFNYDKVLLWDNDDFSIRE